MRRSPESRSIVALVLLAIAPIAAACTTAPGALDAVVAVPLDSAPNAALPPTTDERPGADLARDLAGAPPDLRRALGETGPRPRAPLALGEPGPPPGLEEVPWSDGRPEPGDVRLDPRSALGEAAPPAAAAAMPEPLAERPPSGPLVAAEATADGAMAAGMAQARESILDAEPQDYDPWEPFNERMFTFNYNVDRYVLKPVANVYRHIIPEPFQLMISNGFDNIRYPARLVNHVLQGRFWGAFIETSRFVINSTLGIGGLFNPATDYFGIEKSRADFGQTLHRWGVGPGPYFVPPFFPPATVRDFVGRLADSAINPISWYLLDFWPEAFAIGTGEMVNERAVNYEVFQGVEETTLDLYTAVRDAYLRRRERQLRLDLE